MSAGYVQNSGAVGLTTTVAKTLVNVIAAANALFRLTEMAISFDGVTASAVPALVELCYSTQATAGTPGSSPTPEQIRGPTRTIQATAGIAYSAEPTVLTVKKAWYVPQYNGLFVLQFPLGREVEQIVTADSYLIRVTAAFAGSLNARAYLEFEEG